MGKFTFRVKREKMFSLVSNQNDLKWFTTMINYFEVFFIFNYFHKQINFLKNRKIFGWEQYATLFFGEDFCCVWNKFGKKI